ncbi:sporulation protein [Actinomadura roseirufa]|uniref:sporulation protein n=1 Tax=Actinomadura roseirufa TaxID=2094049 RepID=UPI001040FCC1|nr:sporulation protein [Actinomadura roseirufa]
MSYGQMAGGYGAGGPSVDTILSEPNCRPGGVVAGKVHLRGGGVPVEVRHVTLALMPRMQDGHGGETAGPEVYRGALTRGFRLEAGQQRDMAFSIPLPYELPFTTVLGHELPGFTIGMCTEVDVAGLPDPGDVDPISVEPLESQQWVLAAIARLGFQITNVTFESSKLRGVAQQLPFHQEIHLVPPASHQGRLGKVGLSFVASPHTMAFVLRAEDRSTPSDESFGVFKVGHGEAAETDWNGKILQWLEAAAALPRAASGPPPGQAPFAPAGSPLPAPGQHQNPPPPGGPAGFPPPPPGVQPAAASYGGPGDYGRPGNAQFPPPAPAPGQAPAPMQNPGHGHTPPHAPAPSHGAPPLPGHGAPHVPGPAPHGPGYAPQGFPPAPGYPPSHGGAPAHSPMPGHVPPPAHGPMPGGPPPAPGTVPPPAPGTVPPPAPPGPGYPPAAHHGGPPPAPPGPAPYPHAVHGHHGPPPMHHGHRGHLGAGVAAAGLIGGAAAAGIAGGMAIGAVGDAAVGAAGFAQNVAGYAAGVPVDAFGNAVAGYAGQVAGDFAGGVLGDVAGGVVGDFAGGVVADAAGGVLGDVAGDVAGDIAGGVGEILGGLLGGLFG